MTSAPKSDKMTAAPGAATKLAKSTTFSPEKMLSLAIGSLLNRQASPPQELRGALFEEGGRALFLVLRPGAQAEVGGFEDEALALAGIHSLVNRLERLLDSDRSVRSDQL